MKIMNKQGSEDFTKLNNNLEKPKLHEDRVFELGNGSQVSDIFYSKFKIENICSDFRTKFNDQMSTEFLSFW